MLSTFLGSFLLTITDGSSIIQEQQSRNETYRSIAPCSEESTSGRYAYDGMCMYVSLSTVVLNSRDWQEIIWLPEFSHFKKQPCNRLYPKKSLECISTAIMMLYLG